MDDETPPICPRCGVTMLPSGDGWVCAECEEAGAASDEA